MSKRHQSSRRRAYGRRQHELRERTDRRAELPDDDFGAGLAEPSGDGFSFFELDLAPRRLSFAAGD